MSWHYDSNPGVIPLLNRGTLYLPLYIYQRGLLLTEKFSDLGNLEHLHRVGTNHSLLWRGHDLYDVFTKKVLTCTRCLLKVSGWEDRHSRFRCLFKVLLDWSSYLNYFHPLFSTFLVVDVRSRSMYENLTLRSPRTGSPGFALGLIRSYLTKPS